MGMPDKMGETLPMPRQHFKAFDSPDKKIKPKIYESK